MEYNIYIYIHCVLFDENKLKFSQIYGVFVYNIIYS